MWWDAEPERKPAPDPKPEPIDADADKAMLSDQTAFDAVAYEEVSRFLMAAGRAAPNATRWAAQNFLLSSEAGLPLISDLDARSREDARFWAESATPGELQCYALAATDRLGASDAWFSTRQMKRLLAALWRRCAPAERAAFKNWIDQND